MSKKKITKCAITLAITGKFEKKIIKAWKLLEKINIKYVSTNHNNPHIAITAGNTNSIEEIIFILKKMNLKKLIISSPGLGIFANKDPNLHIRWNLSKEIKVLKKKIDKKTKKQFKNFTENTKIQNWIPKTTIAWKDLKYSKFSRVYNLIDFMFNSDNSIVQYIYVIDFTDREIVKAKIKLKS